MNEKATQADGTIASIIRELPILPVLGFVFALCYEGTFFFFLNIELRQLLTLTDIVESSALKILPAVPLLLLGAMIGSYEPPPKAKNNRERVRNFFRDPLYLARFLIVFSALMYVFFGLSPELGFTSLALVVLAVFAHFAIFPTLLETDKGTFTTVWLLMVATVIFASMGHNDAYDIRFGDRSEFPLVVTEVGIPAANQADLRLIRRLSSGMLVATEAKDLLWFIDKDSSSVLTFKTDPTPFKGILCGGFGWCLSSFISKPPLQTEAQGLQN